MFLSGHPGPLLAVRAYYPRLIDTTNSIPKSCAKAT
jgi:hypothetical protein